MRKRQHRRGGPVRPRGYALPAPIDAAQAIQDRSDAGSDFFRQVIDRKAEQKARQLCRQVYRTLSVALPGCGDEVLQDLTVIAVDPAPDAGHLLVTVATSHACDDGHPRALHEVLDRLSRAAGRLRAEVARDIVRKRAPELTFRVHMHGEVSP